VYVQENYVKELSIVGRNLSRVMIVDNSPQAFAFQVRLFLHGIAYGVVGERDSYS
jgi:TFIIF-interacting CTD phosphatase-like protein